MPGQTYRVIVTGSREFPSEDAVWEALAMLCAEQLPNGGTITVVHGDCPRGADHFARTWCALPKDEPGYDLTVIEENPDSGERNAILYGDMQTLITQKDRQIEAMESVGYEFVQETSYNGSARPLVTVATRRKVQRRNGVRDSGLGWAGGVAHGRGIRAMARGSYPLDSSAKRHQQY